MQKQKTTPKPLRVVPATKASDPVVVCPEYMYFCEIQIPNPKQPEQVPAFISVWTAPPTFDEVYNYIDNNPRTDWSPMDKESMLYHMRAMSGIFAFPELPAEPNPAGQLVHIVSVDWTAAITSPDQPLATPQTYGRVTVRRMVVQNNKKE